MSISGIIVMHTAFFSAQNSFAKDPSAYQRNCCPPCFHVHDTRARPDLNASTSDPPVEAASTVVQESELALPPKSSASTKMVYGTGEVCL